MNSVKALPSKWNLVIVISIVLSFAIATFFLTRPTASTNAVSSASGLMTLHSLSHTSVSYSQALSSSKPTLIEFYADWCTTCQSTAASMRTLQQSFGADVNFVMINIDDPQWHSQIQQYQATGVPQLTLLDADHRMVQTWVGKVPKQVLSEQLKTLIAIST